MVCFPLCQGLELTGVFRLWGVGLDQALIHAENSRESVYGNEASMKSAISPFSLRQAYQSITLGILRLTR